MEIPQTNIKYTLVCMTESGPVTATFTRFPDGSALVDASDGSVGGIYENVPEAWRNGWEELRKLGFVIVEDR